LKRDTLVAKLNWFYSLEINQVDLYKTQSRETKDSHLAAALLKFAEIEQGHVENIRELLEHLGASPTVIGEVVGELTGKITGMLPSVVSWEKILQFNIAIETKAISDYNALMGQVDDPKIKNLLLRNQIDEELHTCWMKEWQCKKPGSQQ
jgi:bacterioferritin